MDAELLQDRVRTVAEECGFDGWGVTTADPFLGTRHEIELRVAGGESARLGFTFSDPAVSTDVRVSWPWAETLVVVARAYLPEAGNPMVAPGHGRLARFAVDDAYLPLRQGLDRIAGSLVEDGFRAVVACDDSRLVDRAAAVRAGVGWWGKNTMVLAPGAGPWLLLGSVVTDAPLEPTAPMMRDCGTCEACLPACPTGALTAGVLDARLCLAAVLQTPGEIPEALRPAVGDRVYGCDDCLEACPPGSRLLRQTSTRRGSVDLVWLLEADDEALLERHRHLYLPGGSVATLRRNALVAAANTPTPALERLVIGYLGHPDPVLRAHAAWAVRRMVGAGASDVASTALQWETDPRVRDALRRAGGQERSASGK